MKLRSVSLTGAFVLLSLLAEGQGTLLGSLNNGTLFSVNLATGAGTAIGTLPGGGSTEIVINASRLAWTQSPDGTFTIQQFDPTSGAGIGSSVGDGASFTGMQFVGATLYGTTISGGGGTSTLRTLNPVTGVATAIGLTGAGPISGLAYNGTTMYGIAGGPGPANFYTINLATGVATLVGATTIQAGSLGFGPDGNLYAGGTGGNAGNIYRINPASGATTLVGATGFGAVGVTGLALLPPAGGGVPLPPSLSFSLIGLCLIGLYATRERWLGAVRRA